MKKEFIHHCFLIFILVNSVNLHGMVTPTARRLTKISPRSTYTPKTIYHTETYTPLTLTERFKRSYNQFKNFLFGPGKAQSELLDEVTKMVSEIKGRKPKYTESLDTFLQENDQKTINALLSKLVFSENELDVVNDYIIGLFVGSGLGVRINEKIIQKIINWAKDNIIQIFSLNLPIDDKFFLLTLLELDLNQKLIPPIHDNLADIQQSPAGKEFIKLLQKKENKKLYDAIIQGQQPFTEEVKKRVQQYKKQLQLQKIQKKLQTKE